MSMLTGRPHRKLLFNHQPLPHETRAYLLRAGLRGPLQHHGRECYELSEITEGVLAFNGTLLDLLDG